MASGKPVTATNTPTLKEVVGECGILVQPRDAKSLADAIMRLVNDPRSRNTLGESPQARALAEYDWRHVVETLNSVYEEIIADTQT
jgi:glycosyltransferase involved in cell wall biosynthesis